MRPPSLGEFLQQFGGNYFSTEGALWRSLRSLLTRPGELTQEYWRGRRKSYVLPLRLYLTVSVFVLLIFRLLGQGMFQTDPASELRIAKHLNQGGSMTVLGVGAIGEIKIIKGEFFCTKLPSWVCDPARVKFGQGGTTAAHELNIVTTHSSGHVGQLMFVMSPLFAGWLKLLYWRRKRFYTEHLVLALHLHSFGFLLMLATTLPIHEFSVMPALALVATGYLWLSLQRVFGGAWWGNFIRAVLLFSVHCAAMLLALYAMVIWVILA